MFPIAVFADLLVALVGVALYPWLRDRRSRAWPVTEAQVKAGKVYASYGTPHP